MNLRWKFEFSTVNFLQAAIAARFSLAEKFFLEDILPFETSKRREKIGDVVLLDKRKKRGGKKRYLASLTRTYEQRSLLSASSFSGETRVIEADSLLSCRLENINRYESCVIWYFISKIYCINTILSPSYFTQNITELIFCDLFD